MAARAYVIILEPNGMDLTEMRIAIAGLGRVLDYTANMYIVTTDLWISDIRDRLWPLHPGFCDAMIFELKNAMWAGRGDTTGYLQTSLGRWLAETVPLEDGAADGA